MWNRFLKSLLLFILLFLLPSVNTYAVADMESYRLITPKSDTVDNWPVGPVTSCYSAVLIDADSGTVLYEKNAHEKMYPASTTKLLTCLLAMEKESVNLNDMVDFSYEAVMSLPSDASNMGMDVGEAMTLEDCIYGILVLSANEVSNAVAEYVSGDIDTFVDLMNERAKELGCNDTHFNNAHGYTDSEHYTTAYDLSLIAREFFKNDFLAKASRTPVYHWYATDTQPDDIYLGSSNYFMRGIKECEGLVGSKTGYTDESRNCLVTCAERNGMRLIAVVMKEETPYQYDDTNSLLDYGFSNFEKIKVKDYDSKYTITDESFFHSASAVFGNSGNLLSMDDDSYIIIPKTISFDDLTSELVLNDEENSDILATVYYSYEGVSLGQANIMILNNDTDASMFDEETAEVAKEEPTFIFVNYLIYTVIGIFIFILGVTLLRKLFKDFHISEKRSARKHWKKRGYFDKKHFFSRK